MKSETFRVGDATAITGISVRRFADWHVKRLLEPSIAGPEVKRPRRGVTGRRPGSKVRRYSQDDLLVAVLIQQLLARGLSLQGLREAVVALEAKFGSKPLYQALLGSRFRIAVSRSGQVSVREDDKAWELTSGQLQGTVVPLGRIARTARELVADWRRRKRLKGVPRRGVGQKRTR
ncbi:MAG: MerR family transcriptional regulator [Candidatus Methylomirabilia bacterium]